MARSQKVVHSMFFLSATHATDSTLRGCTAKRAATKKLRQRDPVPRCNSRNTSTTFMACNKRFMKWCAVGSGPKRVQSNMWESHVSGCQFATSKLVKAQTTLFHVKPDKT